MSRGFGSSRIRPIDGRCSYLGAGATPASIRLKMTTQRDGNPFGTVVQFISKLIQGFKNQKAPEQEPQVLLIFRDKGASRLSQDKPSEKTWLARVDQRSA